MTRTKPDIIEEILKDCDFTRSNSADLTESILEIRKHSLESGREFLINGFGNFCVKQKKKRRGRNPQAGEDLMLAGRRLVTFGCSPVIRENIYRDGKP